MGGMELFRESCGWGCCGSRGPVRVNCLGWAISVTGPLWLQLRPKSPTAANGQKVPTPNATPVHLPPTYLGLAGLHPAPSDDGRRFGRGEEFRKCLCRVRRRRRRVQASGKHRSVLDVTRQRPEVIDALQVQKLAHLLEAEIGLAARHDLANLHAGRGLLHLVLDLFKKMGIADQIKDKVKQTPSG